MAKDEVFFHLEVENQDGTKTLVGTWKASDPTLSNFDEQKDVGWHIFYAVMNGAKSVRVVRGMPVRRGGK